MSEMSNVIQGMINNALMGTHTAFCGKVISVSGDFAKVQPLNMTKAIGGTAQKQAVIPKVPILKPTYGVKVTYTDRTEKQTYSNQKAEVEVVNNIKAGDTVFCVCAERDITETRKGNYDTPVQGRHDLSNAVIVGKF